LDGTVLADITTRFTDLTNRARTTRYETHLVKALNAKTKTLESQQEAIKKAFSEHAKLTKTEKEKLFHLALLAAANNKLEEKGDAKPGVTKEKKESKSKKEKKTK
jgi:hypothetical protein